MRGNDNKMKPVIKRKNITGKRGNLYDDWVEYSLFLLLVLGFVIGISINSPFVNYVVRFLVGIIVGRLFYLKRHYLPFPRYLITAGFVLGFLVGSFNVNWKGLLFVFILGAVFGYQIHKMQIVKEFI